MGIVPLTEDTSSKFNKLEKGGNLIASLFSSPGRSPGRTIVLPLASTLAPAAASALVKC